MTWNIKSLIISFEDLILILHISVSVRTKAKQCTSLHLVYWQSSVLTRWCRQHRSTTVRSNLHFLSNSFNVEVDLDTDEKQEKLITTANRLLDELAREQTIREEQENDHMGYLVINGDEPQFDGMLLDNDKELIKYLKHLQYCMFEID